MKIPNIDTLCATVDIHNYGFGDLEQNRSAELLIKLEQEKHNAKAQETQSMNKTHIITIGSQTFEILPNGSRGYAYILHNDAFEIKIAQHRSKKESFYPIFIRLKSEVLWSMGVEKAWNTAKEWITANVGDIKANKISRIDLCCHTDEIELTAADIDTFEGRYCQDTIYRNKRRVSTMYFGSGTTGKILCRIYDKTLEVKQKRQKLWFMELWENAGLNPEKVWNVEFEFSREYLKEVKLETVEDALSSLKSLWDYCTRSWLTKKKLDNERMTRCTIDPVWESTQEAFSNFQSKGLIKREKQLASSAFALIPGTIGNITSFAARADITDIDELFKIIKSQGTKYLRKKETDYEEVITEKMALLT